MENNLSLWKDKYKPKTLGECVLPTTLRERFESILKTGNLPNLLLCGGAGMGKTTVARILCEQLNLDLMTLNASSENGIDTFRDKVSTFARTAAMFGDYKVVLLDEADNLTPDAQTALRGFIEEVQTHCRFILTCNYPHKLISPLKSRCEVVQYQEVESDETQTQTIQRCLDILREEGVEFKETDIPKVGWLVEDTYPDIRSTISELQRASRTGVLSIHPKAEVATPEQLLESLTTSNTTKLVEWVDSHLGEGRTSLQLLNILTTEAVKTLQPTQLPRVIYALSEAEHQRVECPRRKCLNIAFQAMEEWR